MTKSMTLNAALGAADTKGAPSKLSFWRRIVQSVNLSRQRAAEHEIGRFIEMNGGELTDDLERQISRRFGGPAGRT